MILRFFSLLLIMSLFFQCSVEDGVSDVTLSGSYATLLVVNDYMYAVDNQEIATFDLTNDKDPVLIDQQIVGFGIENIYHSGGVLFIGSTTNLHIFEIGENGIPIEKSTTAYLSPDQTACDPVISDGSFAYVTLSGSIDSPCFFGSMIFNELRIYDVQDITQPQLLSTTQMEFPKGLAIDNNNLFVCEGKSGLKVFDVTDRNSPLEIEFLEGFESYDVIAKDGLLMVVCPTEIRQYDYSNIDKIIYLSSINTI